MNQHTLLESKDGVLACPVKLILIDGIGGILTCKLALQFHGHHRDTSGKTLIDYYREGGLKGIGFIMAVTDQRLRKATLHEYLKPYRDENTGKVMARLQIFSTCEYLISTLPQLVNDERRPEIVADMSDINNPYDALGYGLISYHKKATPPQNTDRRTAVKKHKDRLLQQNRRGRRYHR